MSLGIQSLRIRELLNNAGIFPAVPDTAAPHVHHDPLDNATITVPSQSRPTRLTM